MNSKESQHAPSFDAFLSHASRDSRFAASLVKSLEADGLKAWVDYIDVRFGTLLRSGLQAAIRDSRVLVLVWSEAASVSRWVMAELFTAFHLGRFVIPCVLDQTELPYFLQNMAYLDRERDKTQVGKRLARAVRLAPDGANQVPVPIYSPEPVVKSLADAIAEGQYKVGFAMKARNFAQAAALNVHVGNALKTAQGLAPLDPRVTSLAGYQCKNDYLLKYPGGVAAGRFPRDPLLNHGERYFFDVLCVNPSDPSAVNGLASVLMYEREFDAAEFFQRRAIELAKKVGGDYAAAQLDLDLILYYKKLATLPS